MSPQMPNDLGGGALPWWKRLGSAASSLGGNNPFYGNPGGSAATGSGGPTPVGARPGYGNLARGVGDAAAGIRNMMLQRAQRRRDTAANAAALPPMTPPGLVGAPPPPATGAPPIAQPPVRQSVAQFPPPDGDNFPASLAAGKIVTQPTTAVIGDQGPEAVIPLGGNPDAKVRPGIAFNKGRRTYGQDRPGEGQGLALNKTMKPGIGKNLPGLATRPSMSQWA